jgi:hypothetical protein
MKMSRFGPSDLIARVFRDVQRGDGDFLNLRAEPAKIFERGIENDPDIRRNNVKEKFLWQAEPDFPRLGENFARGPRAFEEYSGTGDGAKQDGGIRRGSRQRTGAIERRG